MDLLSNSQFIAPFFFFPTFSYLNWSKRWIKNVDSEMSNLIVPEVNRYVHMAENPKLVFLHKKYRNSIRESLGLENWVCAFTCRDVIYIFFNQRNRHWRKLLIHESFHAGVNGLCSYNKILPDWFNEGIAYHLSENRSISKEQIKYFTHNIESITELFIYDCFFSSDILYKYNLIKNFGNYFVSRFGAEGVKEVINISARNGDFYSALKQVTTMEISELVVEWNQWTCNYFAHDFN